MPDGTAAQLTAGPLSDGSTGMKLVATAAGDALMCTEFVQLGPQISFGTRRKVSDVTPGPQAWMGLNVELRARDGSGALVSPAGSRYVEVRTYDGANALVSPAGSRFTTIGTIKTPGDRVELDKVFAAPTGAATGKVCLRFVESTGNVEVDGAEVG